MAASILGQVILGWLLADLLGGLFHWWEDRIAKLTTPVIGRWIIAPNREHHARPQAFLEYGFVYRNLELILLGAAVFGAASMLHSESWFLGALCVGVAFQNEVHAWAHSPRRAPRWALPLQEAGILQSPKQHAVHHRPPQDRNYCVLTDWLNPSLEALRVWTLLERLSEKVMP